jgi:nitrite reductase/ring-hydroxylating ferredoxin subunit/DMSO/TMAO reductase YedYZ heme-binding membrane subunit
MSSAHSYSAVGWNRQKKLYDGALWLGIVLYLGVFIGFGAVLRPNVTIETLLIRALGTSALFLLHVILSIGPLCRLDPRFLPLLYNRRHLGVSMFILALAHGAFSIVQFHALGNINPLVSVFVSNGRYDTVAQFPFQSLGVLALAVLFLMAATSHDFWLANLTPPVWKGLHMLVYVAYGLIVMHVALGILQVEPNPLLAGLMGLGMAWVLSIHLVAAWRERGLDREIARVSKNDDGFVDVCSTSEIPEDRAHVVCLSGDRVAVYRYDSNVVAVSSVCQHQNGPLGEGRIIDGCITCPWHGYQYQPETGSSPPPFDEKVPTFNVRVVGGRVLVDPIPNPAGTRVEPARWLAGDSSS